VEMGWIGNQGIQILETPLAVQVAIIYNYLGFMILPLFAIAALIIAICNGVTRTSN
jgi:ABC-type spermidine/putrescine transport system permease subunit I